MTEVMPENNSYLNDFVGRPSETVGWLQDIRTMAGAHFWQMGFPTRRDEEWRFTNISPILEIPFRRPSLETSSFSKAQLASFTYPSLEKSQLVFVNGRFVPEYSSVEGLPSNILVTNLASAIQSEHPILTAHLSQYAKIENNPFTALNTAALEDGALIVIPKGVIVEQPIHLLFVSLAQSEPTVSHPRTLIFAGENSQVTIVESYSGGADTAYFTNAVTEIIAEQNAVIDHYKVQRESAKAFHIATMQVQLAKSSNFSSHSIALGGQLVRNDANAVLGGEGIECTLNGVYKANGRQLVDNHTAIDHAMPNCNSHEIYKGIIDDKARGVFNGKIFVRQDAQKTDAKQTNQTLLLSKEAQIDTKPQLEIFADDVKCTHGATIGQISDEALFYLRARGINEADARSLLIYAFASDVVSRIKVEPVRTQLDHFLLSASALEGIA